EPQRDRRQRQRAQPVPWFLEWIGVARDRQPAERYAEEEDEEQSEQEVRHADAEQRERRAGAVDSGIAPDRRGDANGERDDHGDRHREERELEARAEAAPHVLDDALPLPA